MYLPPTSSNFTVTAVTLASPRLSTLYVVRNLSDEPTNQTQLGRLVVYSRHSKVAAGELPRVDLHSDVPRVLLECVDKSALLAQHVLAHSAIRDEREGL